MDLEDDEGDVRASAHVEGDGDGDKARHQRGVRKARGAAEMRDGRAPYTTTSTGAEQVRTCESDKLYSQTGPQRLKLSRRHVRWV